MKVHVIDGCIACGTCFAVCPEVFKEDEEGFSHVEEENVPKDCEIAVSEAAETCPVSVIVVE